MTERGYHFSGGTPFRLADQGDGCVILRFKKNNKPVEITITPAMAGEYARQCFADPESFTKREQLLLNAWCLGQKIVAEALAVRDDSAGAAASTAPAKAGAPKDQPALDPASAPVSSSGDPSRTPLADGSRACRTAECG